MNVSFTSQSGLLFVWGPRPYILQWAAQSQHQQQPKQPVEKQNSNNLRASSRHKKRNDEFKLRRRAQEGYQCVVGTQRD